MDFLLNIWYNYPIPVVIVAVVGCGVCGKIGVNSTF